MQVRSDGRRIGGGEAIAIAIFALLVVFIFRGVLLTGRTDRVVSPSNTDLAYQFLPLRAFGFNELRNGHIAQWNPYIYGGEPYMAGFQSALFYPPNYLHLLLPLATAVNWLAALHVLLSAATMYLWTRGRGASAQGGVLAGIMFMFCGPVFLRIYAGHLSHLAVMPWPPLLMLAIDRLAATGRRKWCLLGAGAVALAILGGSPQYVYYAALIAAAYTALLLWTSPHRLRLLAGVAGIFFGASLLSAVQLLPGLAASTENVRSGGTDYDFASEYAMPPENLLTAVIPGFFGDLRSDARPKVIQFFGRNYVWETSLFVSVSGLCLAGLAAVGRLRRSGPAIIIVLLTVILALGRHLPIYRLLFDHLPLYGNFRTTAKFGYFTALFLCPLAAEGLDLLRQNQSRRFAFRAAAYIGALTTVMVAMAISLYAAAHSATSPWASLLKFIAYSDESHAPVTWLTDPNFVHQSASYAERAALGAAAAGAATAMLVAMSTRWPKATIGLVVLAGLEMINFARSSWATGAVGLNYPTEWLTAVRAAPGDYRVINPGYNTKVIGTIDYGMILGIRNVWGYDPSVLKRYAETLSAAEGKSPERASQYLPINRDTGGIFQMLRCRFELDEDDGHYTVSEIPDPLPVAQLVAGYTVAAGRNAVLAELTASKFDPRKTMVLEQRPDLPPSPNGTTGPATATILSTDSIEIHAVVQHSTLLLVTENYSHGWHATAANAAGPQQSYTILPANRTLMAIPLSAGVHDIRLDYVTPGYRIGEVVSILSVGVYVGLSMGLLKRRNDRIVSAAEESTAA